MRDPTPKNVAASIRQKLLNLAQERNEDFGLILTKYGLERILFRLSKSKYRDVFILKGALLFEVWTTQRHRPTRDADFLATGDSSPERFVQIFRELSTDFPDAGIPLAFTSEFFADANKVKQWRAFCDKNKSYVTQTDFGQIIARLSSFLVPPIQSIRAQDVFSRKWTPETMWAKI